jgi:CheY-like chemotaxis protein
MEGDGQTGARKLLVIDDDPSIQRSIKRQLKDSAGLDIDFQADPLEGLRMLNRTRYDLVLCDIKMKPISGLEVLAKIKSRHPRLPVIILTGFVDDQIIETAHRLGCAAFLIKPVRKSQLQESISLALTPRPPLFP